MHTGQPCSRIAVTDEVSTSSQENHAMPPDTIALAPTRTKHLPRFRRASHEERPAFRLTDRDREGLKIIYENRWITADMLQDLLSPVTLTQRQQEALDK